MCPRGDRLVLEQSAMLVLRALFPSVIHNIYAGLCQRLLDNASDSRIVG